MSPRFRSRRALRAALPLVIAAGWGCASSRPGAAGTAATAEANPNPMDSIRRLPGYHEAPDTTHFLAPARIARLLPAAAAATAEWASYIERSRAQRDADSSAMAHELAAVGRTTMTRAPYAHGFAVERWMTPAWFAGDSARRMGEIILSFQAPNGGWSKHVDFTKHARRPGESYFAESTSWQWISTIDNGSTTEELRFLTALNAARPDGRHREAFVRGVRYLLDAQMPNGCWPQVWPLAGSYHDAITYNDDATVNAATLLRDVAAGSFAFVGATERARAASAIPRVVDCMVRTQVVVNGVPTIWGQQHDPITFAPVAARSYEMASLASRESAGVADFLMRVPEPDARVVGAVHAAADWFTANALHGYVYVPYERRDSTGAGPLWARMSEIGTNRPIFSNREGKRLYDYAELTDRKTGYAWYSHEPAAMLQAYETWATHHPRAATAAAQR